MMNNKQEEEWNNCNRVVNQFVKNLFRVFLISDKVITEIPRGLENYVKVRVLITKTCESL